MNKIASLIKKVFSYPSLIGAASFTLFLYFLEEALFHLQQIIFLGTAWFFFPLNKQLVVVISSLISFMICFWFVQFSLELPRKSQIFSFIAFSFAVFIEYGFQRAVQRFMLPVDLQIALATPFNTWKGAGALYFNWQFILPVFAFALTLLFFGKKSRPNRGKRLGGLFLLMLAFCFAYAFTHNYINLGTSFSSFYQTIARFAFEKVRPSFRTEVAFQNLNAPQNNIVLIIDESIRADHLSVNGYSRTTTPFLDSFVENNPAFRNWRFAFAGSLCSFPSNALLLTGVRPVQDEFTLTQSYPTVFQYAKAMGYQTVYIDAQTNTLWNGLGLDDNQYIDLWIKAKDLGDDIESDFRAADWIANAIKRDKGQFIVLNKRGVHFSYVDSYPPDKAVWTSTPMNEKDNNSSVAINTYDNGLLYNVNTFFERLFAEPQILEESSIIYTADHAETLFEDEAPFLHCGFTLKEALIPLMMFGRNLPEPSTQQYTASHSNILPTLLDLMGVPESAQVYPYAVSLYHPFTDTSKERYYLDGALNPVKVDVP